MVESPAVSAFEGGFPVGDSHRRVYDDVDLNRAVAMYRLFFAWVSGKAIWEGNVAIGLVPNRVFGTMSTKPKHVGLTLNSDTPYGPVLLDLHAGPFVIEMPPGPLLAVMMDLNQRWLLDMGLPGPDAGEGGKHLLLPPDFDGPVPDGFTQVVRAGTFRVIGGVRSLPVGGDVEAATERLKTVVVRPLNPEPHWESPLWLDLTPDPQDTSPNAWELGLAFWEQLHDYIENEPPLSWLRSAYGELAVLGIEKGKPFAPDHRMVDILERAAQIANTELRVQSFADRRPDRLVWPGTQWQWAALRFENGDFDRPDSVDVDAREKWFFQAIGSSPAMFRRDTKAGSLYWLGLCDSDGEYLHGANSYTLTVPLPVPGKLFWSVTVYDARTRSQVQTSQGNAVLSSLFDLHDAVGESVDLHFGPTPPEGGEHRWIQTIPDAGWFVYFRIYGPESPAFDGSWQLADFQRT